MNIRTMAALCCLTVLGVSTAKSADLNGSFALTGLNATKNGTNLLDTTIFTFSNYLSNSAGAGDYSGVVTGTLWDGPNAAPTTGILDLTSAATMSTFTIKNLNFGTFLASNTAQNQIVNRAENFIDVYLRGIFTPAGTLASKSPTDTSLRISINLSGGSLSSALTLNSPAVAVPEPSTYVLGALATGLVTVVARRRRKV